MLTTHSLGTNRLIPAHAGKTCVAQRGAKITSAHPRSRGENLPSCARRKTASGSSPLTRGKLHAEGQAALRGRLIPAHAGKTRSPESAAPAVTAHPRSRGENRDDDVRVGHETGSSPLTRGKPRIALVLRRRGRLIPAHAGKTEHALRPASSGSYSLMDAYATDAPQDRVRSIGLAPLSSRGAS